jgi:uncharacterized oxidoreductase
MKISGNTILITGGGTGIGLALARALLRQENEVIICGRRRDVLEAAKAANPQLHIRVADVTESESRTALAEWIGKTFPRLNVLVNNAGIQHLFNFSGEPSALTEAEKEIATNLIAPIHLTSLLLPLLTRQSAAAIVNVSSGLGFTPLASMPVYCATKAALHSLTMSLRHQLRKTSVRVFEIIPPIVASELGRDHRPPEANKAAMPADVAAVGIISALENNIFEYALGDAENLRNKRDALFPIMNKD